MKGGGKGFKGRAPVRDPWLVTRISREFCGRNRGSGGWREPKERVIRQNISLENNFIRGNKCNRGEYGMYLRMNNL